MSIPPLPDDRTDSGIIRTTTRYFGIARWTDDAGEHRVEFEDPVIVGSSERAQIRVRHPGISRLQAELSAGPDGLGVLDLDGERTSTYGRSTVGRLALISEGVIRFGDVPMHLAIERRPEQRRVSLQLSTWSNARLDVFERAFDLAQLEHPVVIRGVPNAMFDFFAARIHEASPRADRPFVTVDCWRRDDDERLADLIATRAGVIDWRPGEPPNTTLDVSRAGTLHLRRAKWLSMQAQRDLAAWLFGGRAACDLGVADDTRIVVSSDVPLAPRLNSGFLEALYFALTHHTLQIPELRHRLDDVPVIVRAMAAERGVIDIPEELMLEAREVARSCEEPVLVAWLHKAFNELQAANARR